MTIHEKTNHIALNADENTRWDGSSHLLTVLNIWSASGIDRSVEGQVVAGDGYGFSDCSAIGAEALCKVFLIRDANVKP